METDATNGPVAFPATAWSAIVSASDPPDERRRRLGRLIELYWRPVFQVLRRFEARDNETARDLTQEFFLHLVEHPVVEKYQPGRARFRTFLKGALHVFLAQRDRDAARIKRGSGARLASLDALASFDPPAPVADGADPDAVFDHAWIVAVLEEAVAELRRRLDQRGRERAARVFERHDLAPSRKEPIPSYEEVAAELGIAADQVREDLRIARDMFRAVVAERLRDTVTTPGDLADELRVVFGE